MKQYELYTDGAYQPDEAIAGIGGYLLDPSGNCVFEFSKPIIDSKLFRYHESLALIHGLKKCLEYGIKDLVCYSDYISFRNIFNKDELSEYGDKNNPFKKEIFELKTQFDNILFVHLPRKTNKRADKLAGKILRIYKEETLPNRTRADFVGQEDKYLNIPNLICDEDFLDEIKLPIKSNLANFDEFENLQNKLQYYYLFEARKTADTLDNVDNNNPIDINIYFIEKNINGELVKAEKIASESIIQRKLTSKGLEMLADCFNDYAKYTNKDGQDIGLMFYAPIQPLQKVDMLLRRRGILPIPDTPLTKKFIASTKHFNQIVLHNDDQFILQCLDKYKLERFNNKSKIKM
jgi:ribonuclease HI